MQIELLVRTLLVDEKLLAVSKIAESFDTAAFCLGQLVSHEPELMASLSLAPQVVEGLSAALRKGWSVHHGVAKFSANALTILCICETAREEVRRLAIDELLSGLSAWLEVSLERVDSDEVCGCHCGNAALSACCWLERLLGQPDELLALAVCAHPSLQRIIRDVLRVVSLEDGNSFSLTRLLCVPGLLSALRAADLQTATMAISFVAFSLEEVDDPMYTSDAVQSLLVLLRLDAPRISTGGELHERESDATAVTAPTEPERSNSEALDTTAAAPQAAEKHLSSAEAWAQFLDQLPKRTVADAFGPRVDERHATPWALLGIEPDVVQAWVLLELLGFREGEEQALLARMTLSDKRVWLSRRLYRVHHGALQQEEEALIFVEASRTDDPLVVLDELRDQKRRGVGLGSEDLSGTLEVHFTNENSAGSAVLREWFACVGDSFLAPAARLLEPVAEKESVRPYPMPPRDAEGEGLPSVEAASAMERDYELLGRFLGLALLEQVTVGIRLHPSVCRLLLRGESFEPTDDDVASLDPLLLSHKLRYIRENNVEPLCLSFTDVLRDAREVESAADVAQVELIPGGASVDVTEANKAEYVRAVRRWRVVGSMERSVSAIRRGMNVAVPEHVLRDLACMITPEELTVMLAGELLIDVDDWQANSAITGGLNRSSQEWTWFWQVVRSFDDSERESLLRFVTGSSRPPAGGFARLQGFNGLHLFTINLDPTAGIDSLPRAHACICTIDLPKYSSYTALHRSMLIAATMASVGFDDAAVAGGGDDDDGGET